MNYVAFLVLRRLRAPLLTLIVIWSFAVLGYVLIPGMDDQGKLYHMDFLHAFYFVSYMGSTIGFGETPYSFTPLQRYWTTFCIYATVIGWFYSLGTVVAIMRDQSFLNLVRRTRFRRQVQGLREPFYLVCGYGTTGAGLVANLSRDGVQTVVLDTRPERIEALELDNHPFDIPGLCADMADPLVLQDAGLRHPSCRGVLCLTSQDQANLYVAIASKLLAPRRLVISRVSSSETAANLRSFETDQVIDPFEIFADNLVNHIVAPFHQMLHDWLINSRHRPIETACRARQGRWIICGYGRLGQALQTRFEANGLSCVIVDPDPTPAEQETCHIVQGTGTQSVNLLEADIHRAVGIVAGTPDDTNNLSILMTARELNKGIVTVARQNKPANSPLFSAARADFTMDPGQIIAQRAAALVRLPALIHFLASLPEQSEDWCEQLLQQFDQMVHDSPLESWQIQLTAEDAPAVHDHLRHGQPLTLAALLTHPLASDERLPALPLLLLRGAERRLLPPLDEPLRIDDRILFAGHLRARNRMAWSLDNHNVLRYVVSGSEQAGGYLWKKLPGVQRMQANKVPSATSRRKA